MAQVFCIILAGGYGSRLWPVFQENLPNQMLKLDDDCTLFQRTFLNISDFINDKNIITAVNIKNIYNIKEQLKKLQEKFCRKAEYKIVTEPVSRNTAGAVSLASKYIYDNLNFFSNEPPIILVVPSDEIFLDRKIFSENLEKGIELAKNGFITVFGSKADDFDENMTYFKIRKSAVLSKIAANASKVLEFISNPLKKDIEENKFSKLYINSGIYMFNFETYMSELKKYSKEISSIIEETRIKEEIPSITLKDYEKIPEVSIEDALIANTKKLAFIPIETNWKDIGSWNAIYDIGKKDEKGNCISGNVADIDSKNSFIYSQDKLTATLGLEDMIVVAAEDASFIGSRKHPEGIKRIYKKINNKKNTGKTVFTSWGSASVLEQGEGFLTKFLTVNPSCEICLRKHLNRSEHLIILEGEAQVKKGTSTFSVKNGESIDIEKGEFYSIQNRGVFPVKIIEVWLGDILDENDIKFEEDIKNLK